MRRYQKPAVPKESYDFWDQKSFAFLGFGTIRSLTLAEVPERPNGTGLGFTKAFKSL